MSILLMLDLVNETELIFEKEKMGNIKISYHKTSEPPIEIGSLGYSDITLLETFLATQKFPQVAVPSPKPMEGGEYLEELMKILKKYVAKVLDKQPAESAGLIKAEEKKEKGK